MNTYCSRMWNFTVLYSTRKQRKLSMLKYIVLVRLMAFDNHENYIFFSSIYHMHWIIKPLLMAVVYQISWCDLRHNVWLYYDYSRVAELRTLQWAFLTSSMSENVKVSPLRIASLNKVRVLSYGPWKVKCHYVVMGSIQVNKTCKLLGLTTSRKTKFVLMGLNTSRTELYVITRDAVWHSHQRKENGHSGGGGPSEFR